MLPVLIGAACTCALISVVSFVLYARTRMQQKERKEALYQQIHYVSLFLLFAIGIVIMFYLGAYSD